MFLREEHKPIYEEVVLKHIQILLGKPYNATMLKQIQEEFNLPHPRVKNVARFLRTHHIGFKGLPDVPIWIFFRT